MRGIGKLPCNLSDRRFEPLLSDRASFPAFSPFLFLAATRKRKEEVTGSALKIDAIRDRLCDEGKLVIKDISAR